MNTNNQEAKEKLFDFLKETAEIFKQLKNYSILIEERLPENKAPIHAANELKSLVFHLYNIAENPENIDINLIEAKEHLCRAFYDLHGITVSVFALLIADSIKKFKSTSVATVFPEYGNTIRPEVRKIQDRLREIRADRNTDIVLLAQDIQTFKEQVSALISFDEIIESMRPEIIRYEQEKINEKRNERYWDIFKLVLGVIIGAIGTLFLTKFMNSPKESNQKMEVRSRDSIK